MRVPHASFVALASAALASTASAGFTGWQASVRDAGGGRTFVDLVAGFTSGTDRLLNVFNMNIGLTGGAVFVQGAGIAASRWKPVDDISNESSLDSFVTLGSFVGGDGHMYSSYSTAADPLFTNYTTANATTIPANAGWYNGIPTSTDGLAVALFGNQVGLGVFPAFSKDGNSAAGSLGVWSGHFLVNKAITDLSWTFTVNGSAAFNTGTNAADSRIFHTPAPGAGALLGVAGLARRRRRG